MGLKGTLIPIGGNEDKGAHLDEKYTLDFIQEGILSNVVQESGGTDSEIVIIPTASSIPFEVGKNYLSAFEKLGCNDISVLNIRSKEDAESESFIRKISTANCIMFSGGDQSKITEAFRNTAIHKILLDRLKNEHIVIAGTSAGAMAMSDEMIAGGSSADALLAGAVRMSKGLGLLPQLIIDSHFIGRGRFGRVTEAVARFPKLLGVGLAEDTGLLIKNGNDLTVIGSGMVIFFDPSKLMHNNVHILEEGTPMSMSNMIVHVAANGDRLQIDERILKVLPIESPWV